MLYSRMRLRSMCDVTRLETRTDCESVEMGAIPIRHPGSSDPRVLVAERMKRWFPKPAHAGSTPAGDTRHVPVADRLGARLLNEHQAGSTPAGDTHRNRALAQMPHRVTGVTSPLSTGLGRVRFPYGALNFATKWVVESW